VLVSEAGKSVKQIKLTQHYASCTIWGLIWACFVVSLGVTYLAVRKAVKREKLDWTFMLGPPAWDFAKSWTSTTTLIGGIVSAALALSALPELTKYASRSGYSVLALFISLVAVVAPFLFTVFTTGEVHRDKQGTYSVVSKGPLQSFVLSCAATLFAGLAQLVILFFVLNEVLEGYWFWLSFKGAPPWVNVAFILTALLALGVCVYAGRSIGLTIKLQKDANTDADDAKSKLKADDKREFGPSMLSWPIL
jgi:hypothetical protein